MLIFRLVFVNFALNLVAERFRLLLHALPEILGLFADIRPDRFGVILDFLREILELRADIFREIVVVYVFLDFAENFLEAVAERRQDVVDFFRFGRVVRGRAFASAYRDGLRVVKERDRERD